MNLLFAIFYTIPLTVFATPLIPEKRQQDYTEWQYSCDNYAAPGNFKAFNLPGCVAQLSFNKDWYIGIRWAFEATYADGIREQHVPFRDTSNFGVSDNFYPGGGNNYATRNPGSTEFTAVHEFTNICRGGSPPVSWRFFTTTSACQPAAYRFTSGLITPISVARRPARVSGVSMTRKNEAGDFVVSWSTVSGAAAYSVIVQYPTGTDEAGRPYLGQRGARVQVS